MYLPNAEAAIIPSGKLRDYLLSPVHPIGRYKAAFFRSQGYIPNSWEILARDICSLLSTSATFLETTEFGEKCRINGNITGPNGQTFRIVTIWIILTGEGTPRLVTAYPED
jgi:hypothetical protein